jgi:hypothetical protein
MVATLKITNAAGATALTGATRLMMAEVDVPAKPNSRKAALLA